MTLPKGATDAERMKRAEGYLAAAREYQVFLNNLPPEPQHYPLAYYVAGLAVECLFRAYTELVGGIHDEKHDLRRHAERGRFLQFLPEEFRDEARAHIGDVRSRWLNNHRYRSLAGLRRFLNEAELYRLPNNQFIKGDVVKYNWNVLLDSSLWLLSWGIERWNNSKHGLRL